MNFYFLETCYNKIICQYFEIIKFGLEELKVLECQVMYIMCEYSSTYKILFATENLNAGGEKSKYS